MKFGTLGLYMLFIVAVSTFRKSSQTQRCRPFSLNLVVDPAQDCDISVISKLIAICPNNSQINVTVVADISQEIVSFVKTDNTSWSQKISTIEHSINGRQIMADALLKKLVTSPGVRKKAEIVVLLLHGDVVKMNQTIFKELRKKKIIVVWLGSRPVNAAASQVAADQHHEFELIKGEEFEKIMRNITTVLCKDSHMSCNTDKAMKNNRYTCTDCTAICTSQIQQRCRADRPEETCLCWQCQYSQPGLKFNESNTWVPTDIATTVRNTVLGAFGFVVVVVVVTATLLWKLKLCCRKDVTTVKLGVEEVQQHAPEQYGMPDAGGAAAAGEDSGDNEDDSHDRLLNINHAALNGPMNPVHER